MVVNRFDYLDIAKGFGILAVVWAHIMLVGWTHQICYAFHMPLFFLISGMLFRKDKYNSFGVFFKKRVKRLFVPYIIYSVVTWAIWAAFRMYRGDEVVSYWMPLLQTFIAQGSGAYLVHNSVLWFIPCLFAVDVMYFFISKLRDWVSLLICFFLAALSFVLGHFQGDGWWFLLPWNFDAAMIAMPFYCVGNVLIKNNSHEKMIHATSMHQWRIFVAWIASTLLLAYLTMNFGECSMGSSSYNCSGWMFILSAFVGCGAMLLFSLFLSVILKKSVVYQKSMNSIKWLGVNSLDVMCTHIPIKGVFVILVAAFLHISQDAVSSTLSLSSLVFVATMMAVVTIVLIINYLFRR